MIFHLRHSWIVALALAALLAAPGSLQAQKKSPSAASKKVAVEAAEPDADLAEEVVKDALPADLVANFPVGREFKGVTIPSYEGDTLKSVLTADSVIRVDDQFLDLLNMVVKVYNSAGEPETTISMDEAAFDLIASELTSKTPSTIEQPRFTMTGDTMIFQTHSQIARLVGNVRLVIPDAGDIAPDFKKSATKSPKAP